MNINEILKREAEKIKLDEKSQEIKNKADEFCRRLKKATNKAGSRKTSSTKVESNQLEDNPEVFIGGSLAKGTLIKKDNYDIDIFVRFKEADSDKLEKALKKIKEKYRRIHGSRDYFQVKNKNMVFEIIPVKKIKKAGEAENITDLSYLHVDYVKKQINRNKKLAEEIMLAKAFSHSCNCYGAESYIQGFSGYALELLIIYYKSFLNFLKAVTHSKEKIVIDSAKFYKNKQEIMLNLNEAKLSSPIIVVDPTYKERNATAALSSETFERFKETANRFLKKPSSRFFEAKIVDKKQLEKEAKIRRAEFIEFRASTNRQEGDIAGSKLRKFFNFTAMNIDKYYIIIRKEFVYSGKHEANFYFIARKKKEIILQGPLVRDIFNCERFKKAHKNCFVKAGKLFAKERVIIDKTGISKILRKNMKDMGIVRLD